MSKKNAKKSSPKKLPIIIAAVAGVAAIILLVIFVIAPWVKGKFGDNGPVKPSTYELETSPAQDGDHYEYVLYRGLRMPKEVAEMLNQAEKDNAEVCEKYGVAVRVGDRAVSRPMFELYYNYISADKTLESLSMDLNGKTNTTGFDYNLAPDEQEYPGSKDPDYTWADKFTDDTIEDLQFYFAAFDGAIETQLQLTDGHFQRMIYEYEYVNTYAEGNGQTVEEYLEERSGEHVTYEMYVAFEIMRYYAGIYQEQELEKHKAEVSQAQIDQFYKDYKDTLTRVKARIFPIETYEYDEAELKTLRTEADFLNYATRVTNRAGYDAEIVTRCWWVSYDSIAQTYGTDVADWIFLEKRTPGEIGLVDGAIFPCLIYIDTLPYETTSRQVVLYEYVNNYDPTPEELEKSKSFAEEIQQTFLDGGGTKEAALKLVEDNTAYNLAVSVTDYSFDVTKWLFADDRKPGDYTTINTTEASYFIYYLNDNPEDYDWVDVALGSIGAEAYDSAFAERVEKNYEAEKYNKTIAADAWAHSYKIMEPYIQERKNSFDAAQQ